MADNARGIPQDLSNANGVQNVELLGVSGQADGPVHNESRGRRLSLRAVLFHDNHLQAGHRSAEKCGICSKGLEGALAPSEESRPPRGGDEVVEGGRADQKDAAASSPSDRAGGRPNPMLRSGGS